jgi:aspartyl aminopeptidase
MKDLKEKLFREQKNGWFGNKEEIFEFSKEYINFLNTCKTERETVSFVKTFFSKHSKQELIFVNRNKNVALVRIGKENGMRLIAIHIDSPRIDLKQNPIFEDSNLCLFHTHYYGGIKKYQWLNIPLSLHGVIVKSDLKVIEFNIGENEDDPVFVIPDLLPHLSKKVIDDKVVKEAFDADKLNLIVGSIPFSKEEKDQIKLNILKILSETYGINEEDFISAEITLTPAFKAKDAGFDKSLIAGYGQDDRICAYASLKAFFDSKKVSQTQVVLMVDKEEIGSEGNTSAQSSFLFEVVIEILKAKKIEPTFENIISFFKNSECLSADVNGAVNPMYKEVHEKDNASYINNGVVLTKFTGHGGKYMANDANAEFVGKIRKVFNDNNVVWQTGELGKVDEGGGGTIAKYIANHNIETIDCGPALISMHSPYEISSKADLYETYKAYKAFLSY